MAILRVCVLLMLATALAVQAAKVSPTPGLFMDWLDPTKKAKSQYYEQVEVEHACVRQTSLKNCRDLLPVNATYDMWYLEYKLDCCRNGGSYGDEGNSLMESLREVGMCNELDTLWYKTPIPYEGTDVTKVGKFHATCTFGEQSEKCGGPLCDGLTFTAWGDILRKPDVVFIGKPIDATGPVGVTEDESCLILYDVNPGARKKSARPATTKATTSGSYDDTPLYQGQGDIQIGFFTVTSPHHKTSAKTGHFQLTYYSGPFDDSALTPVDEPPPDAWVAVSSDIKLSFYKSESY